jgi:diaminopimelate decarboxylase
MSRAKKHGPSRPSTNAGSLDYAPQYSFRRASGIGSSDKTHLYCEEVPVERIADAAGTPVYIYSQTSMESAYRRLDTAFAGLPHSICYAVKANSNLSILRVFARLGSCFDIVSVGELARLARIGVAGGRIVFSGVGKLREEIREALRYRASRSHAPGILLFNVESEPELEVLLSEAGKIRVKSGVPASASIRVNPDVLAGGHPHISTGHREHKFGMNWPDAKRLYLAHRDSRGIRWNGIGSHIGSQIGAVAPYLEAVERLASYFRELSTEGILLKFLDIGGGFGIRYTKESPLNTSRLASDLAPTVRPLRCRLLLEPGRFLVGPAGILLTRVLYVKKNGNKKFTLVDAAMNDLIRPVLYGAEHPIIPVVSDSRNAEKTETADVVGPVCETGDFLARDISLPPVEPGDLLAIGAAGAYGFVQSSNYNSRPRSAEILVRGTRFQVIRKRETRHDLMRGES